MSDIAKTLMIFGAGKLGGPLLDLLALRYPHHRYILVTRSAGFAERRLNLTGYMSSQWGAYSELYWAVTDLLDVGKTAELIVRYSPDVIFNAATPFAWWNVNALPPDFSQLANGVGHGMWGALDCVPPMKLTEAITDADADVIHVNGSYPDMVNAFLWGLPKYPIVGIGNISNVVPGLRLAYAQSLGGEPKETQIRLICHHFSLSGYRAGDNNERHREPSSRSRACRTRGWLPDRY
jgi:hypothetical protein